MWGVYGGSSTRAMYAQNASSGAFSISDEPRDKQSVTIHDGTTIEFHFLTNTNSIEAPPTITIEKQLLVWIFPAQPVTDSDYFWRVARKLANLLSFIVDAHLEVTSIVAYQQDFRQDVSLLVTQEPHTIVSENLPSTTRLTFVFMYFNYRKIEDRFDEIVETWFELYEECEYGLDLYFSNSIEKSNRYLSTRYAMALAGLESLYRRLDGNEKKLNKILNELMGLYSKHFGSEDKRRKRASRMVAMRYNVVHGSREAHHIYDVTRELIDTLQNVEALFAMRVLEELGFNVDEVLDRHQGLSGRSRFPRDFGGAPP